MDMSEKNGQPSMEEILASIRRIIADEPAEAVVSAEPGVKGGAAGVSRVDDSPEFELPSIFRSQSDDAQDKQAPRFNRLTDAIRGSQPGVGAEAKTGQPGPRVPAGLSSLHTNSTGQAPGDAGSSVGPAASTQPVSPEGYVMPAAQASAQQPAEEVKRVMAPFKDTRFKHMADTPQSGPASHLPPVAPAPAPQFSAATPNVAQPGPTPGSFTGSPMGAPAPASAAPPPLDPQYGVAGGVAGGGPDYVAGANSNAGADSLSGNGAIEDATAELLRPMLRQWLTDNMPRMVEKALHIEVAESVKLPKKPSGL